MAKDSFDAAAPQTPDDVRHVEIHLDIREKDDGSMDYAGSYRFDVVDADGNPIRHEMRKGNLVPHLTSAHKTTLVDFLNDMLTKAKSVVPE